jgi:hypothetical protein
MSALETAGVFAVRNNREGDEQIRVIELLSTVGSKTDG